MLSWIDKALILEMYEHGYNNFEFTPSVYVSKIILQHGCPEVNEADTTMQKSKLIASVSVDVFIPFLSKLSICLLE